MRLQAGSEVEIQPILSGHLLDNCECWSTLSFKWNAWLAARSKAVTHPEQQNKNFCEKHRIQFELLKRNDLNKLEIRKFTVKNQMKGNGRIWFIEVDLFVALRKSKFKIDSTVTETVHPLLNEFLTCSAKNFTYVCFICEGGIILSLAGALQINAF